MSTQSPDADPGSQADVPADGQVHLAPMAAYVVPVMQEEVQVGTRLVDTGRGVRIHKTVQQIPQLVEQSLAREELHVERVALDQPVEAGQLPEVRYEGETLVIPVFEEVLVVQKQLRLREELRVTRSQRSVDSTQTVVLQSERVEVERFDEHRKGSPL